MDSELAILFLNLEKQLIDFRISQIEKGSVSYVGTSVSREELKSLITNIVRDELHSLRQPGCCNGHQTSPNIAVSDVPKDVIAEKVMDSTSSKIQEVPSDTEIVLEDNSSSDKENTSPAKEVVIKTSAISKGGSAFKVFEPLSLGAVSQNLEKNSVYLPSKDTVKKQSEVMEAVLK